jgi:hypothetical protein
MPINYVRVVNQQTIARSILLDKIDRSQGHFEGSASKAKQKLYVPYSNPVDPTVKGYVDLVPTNEVLLAAANKGTIKGLSDAGRVTFSVVSSALVVAPVAASGVHAAAHVTIGGTTFLSVAPDMTYMLITNLSGVTQQIPSSAFSTFNGTTAAIADATCTIGTPGAGWKVQILANSKLSNIRTL